MNERERAYNKERFKNMTSKEKMGYIWEYYRWHIIGTTAGVIMGGSLLMTIFGPRPPVYGTDILIAGIIRADYQEVAEDNVFFNEELNANINTIPGDWSGMSEMQIANEQLLMIRLVAKEADILILPEVKYSQMATVESGVAFYALDQFEELDTVLTTYEDSLVYGVDEEGQEGVYGIKIDTLDKIPSVVLGEELIFTIFEGAKDIDHTIEMTKYLLE